MALSACGIGESAMAAACVDVAGVHAAFEAARRSPELNRLLEARSEALAAEEALLDAKATQDPLDPDGAAVLAAAETRAATARSALDSDAEAFATALLVPLEEPQRSRVRAWRSAPAGLPPEMRVRAWSDSESRAILAALLDEGLSQTQDAIVNPGSAALLISVRSSAEVLAARACLSDSAAVVAAFRAELAAP